MAQPIVLNTKHDLGVEGAKRQISDRFQHLRDTVHIDKIGEAKMVWQGDSAQVSAKALGQKATAQIDVREHDLTISIQLPMILAPFGKAIVSFIESNADALNPEPKKS